MFKDNLIQLRKQHKLTQEALAEKLGVSRQTLSKWESGDAAPDIEKCRLLADCFGVSLDNLVNYDAKSGELPLPPKGKFTFGSVRVDANGQIVLPEKARRIFHIQPGDELFVLGDEDRGLALMKQSDFLSLLAMLRPDLKLD